MRAIVLQTLYMVDRLSTSGLDNTLRVECLCVSFGTGKRQTPQTLARLPLVPVTELIERGLVRMSMTAGFCSHGTRK